MAKSEGPLFSLNASGSIKKTLNYQQRKEGQKVRKYNKPTGKPTIKQRERRRIIEFIVAQWQGMTEADKDIWRGAQEGKRLGITGYQYFLKEAQRDLEGITGLKCYFPFSELVGGYVYDLIENTIRFEATTLGVGDPPTITESFFLKMGKCLLFDGVSGNMESDNFTPLLTGQNSFFVELWVKLIDNPKNPHLLRKWDTGINGGIFIRASSGILKVRIDDGQNTKTLTGTTFFKDNKRHCIQARIDRTNNLLTAWVDGVEQDEIDISTITGDLSPDGIAEIGAISGWLEGLYDELCIYWRELTNDEIQQRYKFGSNKVER